MDITAGGGIPFEAGRLGIRSHANDLNPVAALILRATCRWPQKYGRRLPDLYDEISRRFQNRVAKLVADIYPPEEQPEWMAEWNERCKAEIKCPSCGITIPLSPNWRSSSKGDGLRLLPNPDIGKCDFQTSTNSNPCGTTAARPASIVIPIPIPEALRRQLLDFAPQRNPALPPPRVINNADPHPATPSASRCLTSRNGPGQAGKAPGNGAMYWTPPPRTTI